MNFLHCQAQLQQEIADRLALQEAAQAALAAPSQASALVMGKAA